MRADGKGPMQNGGLFGARTFEMMNPGLIVAPLTPFTADLEVDRPALRRQIDYVVADCGATMVVAAGVETQEYTYLSLEQRKALIRHTIEFVDGRVPVMVGTSHPSFRTAVEFRRPTKALEDAVAGGGIGLRVLTFGACLADGGVPIIVGGKIIGAIGVSGAAGHEDAQVATAGAAAAP